MQSNFSDSPADLVKAFLQSGIDGNRSINLNEITSFFEEFKTFAKNANGFTQEAKQKVLYGFESHIQFLSQQAEVVDRDTTTSKFLQRDYLISNLSKNSDAYANSAQPEESIETGKNQSQSSSHSLVRMLHNSYKLATKKHELPLSIKSKSIKMHLNDRSRMMQLCGKNGAKINSSQRLIDQGKLMSISEIRKMMNPSYSSSVDSEAPIFYQSVVLVVAKIICQIQDSIK